MGDGQAAAPPDAASTRSLHFAGSRRRCRRNPLGARLALTIDLIKPFRRTLSRRLVRAAGDRGQREVMTVQQLIDSLGDRSFGWCLLLFALINMMPMPPGGTMISGIPIVLITFQMARGLPQLWLPRWFTRREIGRRRFQKLVLRMAPVMRPIERMVRPRYPAVFFPRNERMVGMLLFAVAVTHILPIPFSGYFPATALLIGGVGLVERDGLVVVLSVVLGLVAMAVTAAVGTLILLGATALVT